MYLVRVSFLHLLLLNGGGGVFACKMEWPIYIMCTLYTQMQSEKMFISPCIFNTQSVLLAAPNYALLYTLAHIKAIMAYELWQPRVQI